MSVFKVLLYTVLLTLFEHIQLEVGGGISHPPSSHTGVGPTLLQIHSTQLQQGHGEHDPILLQLQAVDGGPGIVGDSLSLECPGDVGRRFGETAAGEDGSVPGGNLRVGRSDDNFS